MSSQAPEGRTRRGRALAALGALLIIVILLLLWNRVAIVLPEPSEPAARRSPETTIRYGAAPRHAPRPKELPRPLAGVSDEEDPPPVIDEIIVEKEEVCEGEENLVTVFAHTVNGTDEFLQYTIAGGTGQSVPVRQYLPDDPGEELPQQYISVFGRNRTVTQVPVPPYRIKRCKLEHLAIIEYRLQPNSWSAFDFKVTLRPGGGEAPPGARPFVPKRYVWTLGDGTTRSTGEPFTSHSFEDRDQGTMFSNMLITVEVHGEGRERPVVGRTSLQLINPAFETLAYRGVVLLMIELTPRFPEMTSYGMVEQGVRIYHFSDEDVLVERMFTTHAKIGNPDATPQRVAVKPQQILRTAVVPPGRGITVNAFIDTQEHPDVFSITYDMEGRTNTGTPARGSFSVMRPADLPTKDKHVPVRDPLLKAKILRAQEILGQKLVTDEDLFRLERQGHFADLKEDPNAPIDETPPPDLPKPVVGPDNQRGVAPMPDPADPTGPTSPGGAEPGR